MLVFERREGEAFRIGGLAEVTVSRIKGGSRVHLTVEAPRHVPVFRNELTTHFEQQLNGSQALEVMILEDDDDFAELLVTALETHGAIGSLRYRSVPIALNQLESVVGTASEPDLLIVDYHLPGGSGAAFVEQLRQSPAMRRTPAIMLSGDPTDDVVDSCFRVGATAFMEKPQNFAQLNTMVERLLMFWSTPGRV